MKVTTFNESIKLAMMGISHDFIPTTSEDENKTKEKEKTSRTQAQKKL
jgi:hypothetical protein